MLNIKNTFSSFSVNDLEKALEFYSETLGLSVTKDEMGFLNIDLPGGDRAIVYPKGTDHKPAVFTVLNFVVGDIEEAVDTLTSKGITFEQYEGNIETDEKGISRGPGPLIAWFKDPAGNILSIIEEYE
ncbi:VOC family protein [Gracilimonas sp. BCB1]|uniref:VOC family protein n=1 Tax=Gracilimonas sp. BCB1 TaxID=3152362 RepID=UPI0032D91045